MAEMTPLTQIEKALIGKDRGLTIQQIIDQTGLARGTVKTYLDELIRMGRAHEEEYGQNTKVFFLNGEGKYKKSVKLRSGVLYVDVMTDPWKKPFIRVKYRNNENKDVGAIFLNDEKAVDELIEALRDTKPQLDKYRELIKKLEEPIKS